MEYALILFGYCLHFNRNCLNPYSNRIPSDFLANSTELRKYRLNPYSNGTLSDTLSESTLRFHPFIFPNNFLLKIRELIHLELYFRKCKHSEHTFQTKKGVFQQITFISSKLHLRKRNPCLNNIRDLRKPTNRAFDNSLIMNTKCQRTNRH